MASMLRYQDPDSKFKTPPAPNKCTLLNICHDQLDVTGPVLGKGRQGEVKKALFRGTDVAVKFINKRIMNKSALKEIELLSRFRHPNIISIMAQSQTDTDHVIVMEYFKGHTLHDFIHYDDVKKAFNLN